MKVLQLFGTLEKIESAVLTAQTEDFFESKWAIFIRHKGTVLYVNWLKLMFFYLKNILWGLFVLKSNSVIEQMLIFPIR